MTAKKWALTIVAALPAALATFISGASYFTTSPSTGFTHPRSVQDRHLLATDVGDMNAWLELRFDRAPRHATVTLSNGTPLSTWLTLDTEGNTWLNVAAISAPAERPKKFIWLSGVQVVVMLPQPAALVDWKVNRDNAKSDSKSATWRRRITASLTFLFLLLTGIVTYVAPHMLATDEEITARDCIKSMIRTVRLASPEETRHGQQLLEAVVFDGTSFELARDTQIPRTIPYQRRQRIAVQAVGVMKSKLSKFRRDLDYLAQSLDRNEPAGP